MRKILALLVFVLVFGISLWNPAILAEEHGGKEHGGQEHGGSAVEESPSAEEGVSAVLREAAEALRLTRPDLAEKLEKMAEEEVAE